MEDEGLDQGRNCCSYCTCSAKFNDRCVMSSSARDAFIAGSRGAPNYRGSTTNEAFKRGRQSADEFRRNRRFKKPKRRVSSNRWDRRLANNISDIFSGATEDAIKMGKDAKTGIMGAYGAMAKAGKELFMDPMLKASENKKILGDALTDNLRESVMTPSDDAFYKKYMRLADLATDNQERERLIGEANTALRNAQISSRINYGLGQLGEDTLGKEGFDSFKQPMFGEATPRFNMADFTAGLGSTDAGQAFLAEAEKAQAEETSGSPIGNAMKNFTFTDDPTTFVGTMGSIPSFMLEKDGMVVPPQESDMNYFDPYLSPNIPFFPKGET